MSWDFELGLRRQLGENINIISYKSILKTLFVYFEFFIMGIWIRFPLTNNFSRASSCRYLPIPVKGVLAGRISRTLLHYVLNKTFEFLRTGFLACILVFKTVTLHCDAGSQAPPSIKDRN